jgi:hypothetical protein
MGERGLRCSLVLLEKRQIKNEKGKATGAVLPFFIFISNYERFMNEGWGNASPKPKRQTADDREISLPVWPPKHPSFPFKNDDGNSPPETAFYNLILTFLLP